jgi:HEAT repeats
MTPEHTGDMIEAGAYSVDELREALFEGRGPVARPLALALLTRKDYREKGADLRRVLSDEKELPRLRALAASGLGEIATPASVRALEQGLQSQESVTMRASAKALANVGSRKHLEMLQGLAQDPGPVGRDAQRAVKVLSERLKLRPRAGRVGAGERGLGNDLPADGDARGPERGGVPTLPLQATGKTTPIRIEAPDAREVTNAIKTQPSRKLARRAAVSMKCLGRQLVFVFDEEALGQGIGMFKRGGEIGIVAEPPGVEGMRWSLRYRIAVEPQSAGAWRLLVTTPDGRTMFFGRGATEGHEAMFELAAADVPGALPVEMRGRFDGKKVTFDQARSAVRRRASPDPTREGGTHR